MDVQFNNHVHAFLSSVLSLIGPLTTHSRSSLFSVQVLWAHNTTNHPALSLSLYVHMFLSFIRLSNIHKQRRSTSHALLTDKQTVDGCRKEQWRNRGWWSTFRGDSFQAWVNFSFAWLLAALTAVSRCVSWISFSRVRSRLADCLMKS